MPLVDAQENSLLAYKAETALKTSH